MGLLECDLRGGPNAGWHRRSGHGCCVGVVDGCDGGIVVCLHGFWDYYFGWYLYGAVYCGRYHGLLQVSVCGWVGGEDRLGVGVLQCGADGVVNGGEGFGAFGSVGGGCGA